MNLWVLVGLMIAGGVGVALQGQFMGVMDVRMGSRESVFITYACGGIVATVLIVLSRGGQLKAWPGVPWYMLSTAGLLGILVVGSMGYTIPRLGLAKSLTIMVASQLLAALLIDHFGLFGASVRTFSVSRFGGLILMILGVWFVLN